MFIPDEMKLNRFKLVSIPSAREYFKLYGERAMASSAYSGDEAPLPEGNKVDTINDFMQYAEEESQKASKKDE